MMVTEKLMATLGKCGYLRTRRNQLIISLGQPAKIFRLPQIQLFQVQLMLLRLAIRINGRVEYILGVMRKHIQLRVGLVVEMASKLPPLALKNLLKTALA